jgi:hypothetical protein
MRVVFDKEVRAKEMREDLTALQHRVPSIEARIEALRAGLFGATAVYQRVLGLTTESALPEEVARVLRSAVQARSGSLVAQRLATEAAREIMKLGGQRHAQHIEEVVGQLEGLSALFFLRTTHDSSWSLELTLVA